jgi:DNA-binding transcriptional LysR family regulator
VRLEDVLERLADRDASGTVRLGAYAQLGQVFLLPAIRVLTEQYPKLQLSIVHLDPDLAIERLKGGMLDLFLGFNVAVGEPLAAMRLGNLQFAIFCGKQHPLFGAERITEEDLEKYGFVAQRRPGLMKSIWPKTLKRMITLDTDSHAIALDACLAGTHLMFKERVVVAPLVEEGRLHEIPVEVEPAELVLLRHVHSQHHALLDKVAFAIQTVVEQATDQWGDEL